MEERLISEPEVMKILNLKKQDLAKARHELGLTFVKVTQRARLYLLSDLLEWAKKNRVTLNKDID